MRILPIIWKRTRTSTAAGNHAVVAVSSTVPAGDGGITCYSCHDTGAAATGGGMGDGRRDGLKLESIQKNF